jgi:hypothetical protein
MSLSGTLSRSTALLLLGAIACGETATEFEAKAARQRADTQWPTTALSGTTTPPTLVLTPTGGNGPLAEHTPPGKNPCDYYCGPFYRLEAYGTGFAPRSSWQLHIMIVLSDGTVLSGGSGSGVDPKDGTTRMIYSGNCPSRIREAYAVAFYDGKTLESKHVVPTC